MGDLIERYKAIEAVMDALKRIPTNAIRAKAAIKTLDGVEIAEDCISRQAAIEALKKCKMHCIDIFDGYHIDAGEAEYALVCLPAVQPMRKRGRWEMLQIPIHPPVHRCSVCGQHAPMIMAGCLVNRHLESMLSDFCPNCGADMRGGQE